MFILNLNHKLNDKSKLGDLGQTQTIIQRENPHKYLLYKPSFSQFFTYIASAFKDLVPHSLMLLYISADGCETSSDIQVESNYLI